MYMYVYMYMYMYVYVYMYMYVYIYIYTYSSAGWNSQAHTEFPRSLESSNLSGDNLSREIERRG